MAALVVGPVLQSGSAAAQSAPPAEPAARAPKAGTAAAPAAETDADTTGVITVIGDRETGMGLTYKAAIAGQRAVDAARAEMAPLADVQHQVYRGKPAADGRVTPVRVSLVADGAEVLVTEDGTQPFKFPVDERLLASDARIVVRGAGALPSVWWTVTGTAYSARDDQGRGAVYPAYRLGEARLLCAYLVAANREMAQDASWLVAQLFGRFTCHIPIQNANPAQHRVWLVDKGRKPLEIEPRKGVFHHPTYLGLYSFDAMTVVVPRDAPQPGPELPRAPAPQAPLVPAEGP